MAKFSIFPYVSRWGASRVWVFDDPDKGLKNEGLVSGTDIILDRLSSRFHNGEKGFKLTFADEPFPGQELAFEWINTGEGKGLATETQGNWYEEASTGFKGWLCPALFLYFPAGAPKNIYVQAEAINGPLERGTGQVVIQGKTTHPFVATPDNGKCSSCGKSRSAAVHTAPSGGW